MCPEDDAMDISKLSNWEQKFLRREHDVDLLDVVGVLHLCDLILKVSTVARSHVHFEVCCIPSNKPQVD